MFVQMLYQIFLQSLNAEVIKILQTTEMKERFIKLGAEAFILSPDQFDRFMDTELKTLGSIMSQVEDRK